MAIKDAMSPLNHNQNLYHFNTENVFVHRMQLYNLQRLSISWYNVQTWTVCKIFIIVLDSMCIIIIKEWQIIDTACMQVFSKISNVLV